MNPTIQVNSCLFYEPIIIPDSLFYFFVKIDSDVYLCIHIDDSVIFNIGLNIVVFMKLIRIQILVRMELVFLGCY
jgi:hypothetical protein